MFERFTPPARRVVVLAQEEARQLQHNYIGTEHVLLGLISSEPNGLPARVLQGTGLTLEEARQEVVAIIGRGKATPTGHIPFTPRAKKTLELALREALQLHHNYIGPEHILLGVIREGHGVGAQVIRNHADLAVIRQEVIQAVPPGGGARVAGRWWLRRHSPDDPGEPGAPGEAGGLAEQPGLSATPAADTTLSQAARLAGARPVGSHHLLLAALSDANTAAVRALGSLGVDLELAREALRNVDVTGTSDEQPEEAGRRQMVIRVTSGKLTLEATDPVLVKAAFAAAGALGDEAHPADTIRGDAPECASLGIVWRALRESLDVIAEQGPRPQARLIQGRRRPEAGETSGPDTPDTPGTETA
jgi:ATP-dependent Clp protease ATP-binding subunit ClpA